MRFGTRVLPMVGLLAVLDRVAATATRAAGAVVVNGRVVHRVELTVIKLSESLIGKDER